MNRPYTICHIFSGLDGAIAGNYMYAPEANAARTEYGKIRESFDADAILYGTTTMAEFCGGYVEALPKSGESVERKDYVAPHAETKYVVALDCEGKLNHTQNYLERHGLRQHIIALLTKSVSSEYLSYLQGLGISYIFAGSKELECEIAMTKLKELFGIERLVIAGGGYTDWTFTDAGMVDELSVVLAPVADGEQQVTVFERTDSSVNNVIAFKLKSVKLLEGDGVWLRYTVNNTKK